MNCIFMTMKYSQISPPPGVGAILIRGRLEGLLEEVDVLESYVSGLPDDQMSPQRRGDLLQGLEVVRARIVGLLSI
jgi:hypothetical protein